jgi:hypothetical protein
MPDQSVGDTFALSDWSGIIVNNPFHIFSLSDTLTLSDSVRFSTFGLRLTLSDNFNLSDSIRTSRIQNTSLSDTISISDALSVTLNSILGISDAIYIFDALSAGSVFGVSDTISLSDTLSVTLTGGTSDAIFLSDILLVGLALGVFDILSLSDDTTSLLLPTLLTNLRSDTLYLSDSIFYVISNSLIVLSDGIPLSDRINVILNSSINSYLRRYLNDVIN